MSEPCPNAVATPRSVRTSRRVWALVATLGALAACGTGGPSMPRGTEDGSTYVPLDATSADTRTPREAATDDVTLADGAHDDAADDSSDDAAPEASDDATAIDGDASGDDAIAAPDASSLDAGAPDTAVPPPSDVTIVLTACGSVGPMSGTVCTSDADCAPRTERCLPSGCDTTLRCQPAGRPCATDADCLAGAQSCTAGRCVARGDDCGDTRACPLGYVCEGTAGARRCVDRRRPCATDRDCPYNSLCYDVRGLSPFCVVVPTRCSSNVACVMGASCRDVDGDGLRECMPPGTCDPATCTDRARPTCEIFRDDYDAVCGPHGVCSSAARCAPGWTCVDAWNTGVTTCALESAPCQTESDCATPRTLCMDQSLDGDAGLGCR